MNPIDWNEVLSSLVYGLRESYSVVFPVLVTIVVWLSKTLRSALVNIIREWVVDKLEKFLEKSSDSSKKEAEVELFRLDEVIVVKEVDNGEVGVVRSRWRRGEGANSEEITLDGSVHSANDEEPLSRSA